MTATTTTARDDALAILHALVLDDGRRWGEVATDWQREDAAAVLDPDHPEKLHYDERPKGGSKTTDAAGIALAWLLTQAPPLAEGYVVAPDQDAGNRLLNRARGFIARTPELRGKVTINAWRIVGPNGAYVQALAADVAGSEGILSPFIVVDELTNWKSTPTARDLWTSIVSGIPKWPGMRLVVISHAGDPVHWSRKILDQALKSPRWRVHQVPGPLEWVSEDDLEEQRGLLSDSQYQRRHLNAWVASEDRLVDDDDLAACVTLAGPLRAEPGVRYIVATDIGVKRDRTVVAVAHAVPVTRDELARRRGAHPSARKVTPLTVSVEPEDEEPLPADQWFDLLRAKREDRDRRDEQLGTKIVLDRMKVWTPSPGSPVNLDEVEDYIAQASRLFNDAKAVFDPDEALGMMQRLEARDVRCEEFIFTLPSVGKLGQTLHVLLRDHMLDLPDDEELLDELRNVRLTSTSLGQLRLNHDPERHDDRAVALAIAATVLLESPPSSGPAMTSYDPHQVLHGRR